MFFSISDQRFLILSTQVGEILGNPVEQAAKSSLWNP